MRKFTVTLEYLASVEIEVYAKTAKEAEDKARNNDHDGSAEVQLGDLLSAITCNEAGKVLKNTLYA